MAEENNRFGFFDTDELDIDAALDMLGEQTREEHPLDYNDATIRIEDDTIQASEWEQDYTGNLDITAVVPREDLYNASTGTVTLPRETFTEEPLGTGTEPVQEAVSEPPVTDVSDSAETVSEDAPSAYVQEPAVHAPSAVHVPEPAPQAASASYTARPAAASTGGAQSPRHQYVPYDGYYGYRIQPSKASSDDGVAAKIVVGVLCVILLLATAFGGALIGAKIGYGQQAQPVPTNAEIPEGGTIKRTDARELQNSQYNNVADLVTDVSHSLTTVMIDSTYATGVVFAEDADNLYVATTYHNLPNSRKISMIFGEETSHVYAPQIQGVDTDSDLAVLKLAKSEVDESQRNSIKIATMGDSTGMVLGDLAIAFSSPHGYFNTPSLGTISGLERSVSLTIDGLGITMDMIQTDAAINTSGVLVNGRGEVIGLTLEMTFQDSEGIGFAIPSEKANDVLGQILERGYVVKPYMGFSGYDAMNFYPNNDKVSWAEYYQLPMGVLVATVNEGSPADKGGLEPYDLIIAFNGKTIENFDDMKTYLNACEIGETITIDVLRGYMNGGEVQKVTLTITVAQKPQPELQH
ncbi:MAG: PDZ domain-containing protein [Firmicutes bacterium]|nr:PDZ domain-containing protein [Bacillota bacterium]